MGDANLTAHQTIRFKYKSRKQYLSGWKMAADKKSQESQSFNKSKHVVNIIRNIIIKNMWDGRPNMRSFREAVR